MSHLLKHVSCSSIATYMTAGPAQVGSLWHAKLDIPVSAPEAHQLARRPNNTITAIASASLRFTTPTSSTGSAVINSTKHKMRTYSVSLGEQKLGQVGSILSSDSGDKGNFSAVVSHCRRYQRGEWGVEMGV